MASQPHLIRLAFLPLRFFLSYPDSLFRRPMWQQILAVLLVFALLIGTLFLLRRKGIAQFSAPLGTMAGKARQMRVVERLALGPQHALVLVSIRNSTFLIGLSPSGCSKLDVLPTDPQTSPESGL